MGRKKESDRREKQDEWLRWRWEFLRDNLEYREAYKTALELRQESGVTDDFYPHTAQGRRETVLAKEWGLLGELMIDPAMSFEEMTEKPIDTLEKRNFRPTTFYSHFAKSNLDLKSKKLTIEVDLSKVNSFDALPEEIKKLVSLEIAKIPKARRKFFAPGGKNLKGKDYYDILVTGRTYLEMQRQSSKRVTYKQLGKQTDRRGFKLDPEGVRRKKETTYHEYERLTAGGYREISYP